jgi:hypothetical protein
MAEAALGFLESLDADARKATRYPLAPEYHRDWHYVPRSPRPGLALKHMSGEQRDLVFRLIGSALSERGLQRVREILVLERILGELTQRPDFRDPQNYALAIFGDPAGSEPWAWRFEEKKRRSAIQQIQHRVGVAGCAVAGRKMNNDFPLFAQNRGLYRPCHAQGRAHLLGKDQSRRSQRQEHQYSQKYAATGHREAPRNARNADGLKALARPQPITGSVRVLSPRRAMTRFWPRLAPRRVPASNS